MGPVPTSVFNAVAAPRGASCFWTRRSLRYARGWNLINKYVSEGWNLPSTSPTRSKVLEEGGSPTGRECRLPACGGTTESTGVWDRDPVVVPGKSSELGGEPGRGSSDHNTRSRSPILHPTQVSKPGLDGSSLTEGLEGPVSSRAHVGGSWDQRRKGW